MMILFLHKINQKHFFFENNLPVYKLERINSFGTDMHQLQLKNSLNAANQIIQNVNAYSTFHLPVQFKKSINAFCLYKLGDKIKTFLGTSKFRTNKDILQNMFYYVNIGAGKFKLNNENRGKFYYFNNKKLKYNFNYPMVCLNESGNIDESDILWLTQQLNNIFPNKSNFEV